jgi:hypothetical protein
LFFCLGLILQPFVKKYIIGSASKVSKTAALPKTTVEEDIKRISASLQSINSKVIKV